MSVTTGWATRQREAFYRELDHPADLLLEVWGADPGRLYENALFALYDELVDLTDVRAQKVTSIDVEGPTPADILRRLLAEALYRFYTDGFIGAAAQVTTVDGRHVVATVYGEMLDPARHRPLTEIKAVTYHLLDMRPHPERGWTATVLFDV